MFEHAYESGVRRSKIMAKQYWQGTRSEGFANFSATPPLNLVNFIVSSTVGGEHVDTIKIWMMDTDISFAYFQTSSNEEKCVCVWLSPQV